MATTMYTLTQAAGTSAKKFTVSMWFKIGTASGTGAGLWGCGTGTGDGVSMVRKSANEVALETWDGSSNPKLATSRKVTDPAAWYHLVFSIDTTDADSAERLKIWINGVEETSFATDITITLDSDIPGWSGSGDTMKIGNRVLDGDAFFEGEMSHVHVIDGTIYGASTFGETDSTSGIWKIKTAPTVTYGTNGGFYKFESGALTTDSSGEGNTLTQVGSPTETKDNPSNNFATWNPLMPNHTPANNATYSNGNTSSITTATGGLGGMSSQGSDVSKWYAEIKMTSESTGGASAVGVYKNPGLGLGANSPHDSNKFYGVRSNGTKLTATVGSGSWGASYSAGDILSLALDIDNDRLYIAKNGLWSDGSGSYDEAAPDAYVTLSSGDEWFFGCGDCEGGGTAAHDVNFGNGYFGTTAVTSAEADDAGIGAFEYAPPTGYYALCTKNIKAYGG